MKKEEPKYISLAEAAKLTSYSQDYISLLCRQGKLQAVKLGRNWVTTKEWVYSYVDNTAGKGESVVPVRIKESAAKAKPEAAAEKDKGAEARKRREPFYGQRVLEFAFFCFACLLWAVNINLFYNYFQQKTYAEQLPAASAGSERPAVAGDSDSAADNDLDRAITAAGSDGAVRLDNLPAFAPETDPAVSAAKLAAIRNLFGAEVDAEIYQEFAVVSYRNAPEQKFLYILK